MKTNKSIVLICILSIIVFVFSSCGSESGPLVPALTTADVSVITQNTAISGGNVSPDVNSNVIARGVCWSITVNPTVADNKTTDGIGDGVFTSSITNLLPGTTYYVRAYATNSAGTGYGNTFTFKTIAAATSIKDNDGNTCRTVNIGTQTWMAENLNSTKFRSGEAITNIKDATEWKNATYAAWCDYNNDTNNGAIYGKLYNWEAVSAIRNIAPLGWHIATDADWTTLIDFLGGESEAASKLKEMGLEHWASPNTGATNETGFTALPGGYRSSNGGFNDLGSYAQWWTSTEYDTNNSRNWYMNYNNTNVHRDYDTKICGRSVRCVKD